jgi:hypothetical protein
MKNPLEIASPLQFPNYSQMERLPSIYGFQNGLSGMGYLTREYASSKSGAPSDSRGSPGPVLAR